MQAANPVNVIFVRRTATNKTSCIEYQDCHRNVTILILNVTNRAESIIFDFTSQGSRRNSYSELNENGREREESSIINMAGRAVCIDRCWSSFPSRMQ